MFVIGSRNKLAEGIVMELWELVDAWFDIDGHRAYAGDFPISLLDGKMPENPVILDVGSYDCGDSIRFRTKWPKATIHAIEADPDMFAGSKWVETMGIRLHNYAVIGNDGVTSVTFNRRNDGVGSLHHPSDEFTRLHPDKKWVGTVSVPAITLWDFCGQNSIDHIDLLHMDIEGGEHEAMLTFLGRGIVARHAYLEQQSDHWNDVIADDSLRTLMEESGYELIRRTGSDGFYSLRQP